MRSSGKTIGILLMLGGLICGALGGAWTAANLAEGTLESGGSVFAIALVAVVALPLLGAGEEMGCLSGTCGIGPLTCCAARGVNHSYEHHVRDCDNAKTRVEHYPR